MPPAPNSSDGFDDGSVLPLDAYAERAYAMNEMRLVASAKHVKSARGGSGSQPTTFEENATAIMREVDEIVAAEPTLRGAGQVISGNANWPTTFYGITPEYLEVRGFESAEINGSSKAAQAILMN